MVWSWANLWAVQTAIVMVVYLAAHWVSRLVEKKDAHSDEIPVVLLVEHLALPTAVEKAKRSVDLLD